MPPARWRADDSRVEDAYARAVAAEGNRHLLRQAFVDRPGHCNYTAAEIIATVQTLERRLDKGSWGDSATARELNRLAAELDAASPLELGTAGFSRYDPDRFLRPYYPADQRI